VDGIVRVMVLEELALSMFTRIAKALSCFESMHNFKRCIIPVWFPKKKKIVDS
jgi:hypothetical protein